MRHFKSLVFIILIFTLTLLIKQTFYEPYQRFTRNMSYDLRGDPCITRPTFQPFYMSSWAADDLQAQANPRLRYCDEIAL